MKETRADLFYTGVDLQDLLVTFDLAHADLAGELRGADIEALQREGTVQRLLVTAPYMREGELLQPTCRGKERKDRGKL